MAEKKKKPKPGSGGYASTTRKTLPAGGAVEILDTAKAMSGVNQTLRPDPKLTKKGK